MYRIPIYRFTIYYRTDYLKSRDYFLSCLTTKTPRPKEITKISTKEYSMGYTKRSKKICIEKTCPVGIPEKK